ncbi:MAG: SGNH/GDSL hydrolase family protein [Acidobacteriota bacterium]
MTEDRRAPRIAFFVLAQFLLIFLLVEGGLRLLRGRIPQLGALLHLETVSGRFGDAETTEELLAGSSLGFRPGRAAGGVRLNERGFATGSYAGTKAAATQRIAVLGDSFVFNDFPHEWMWHTLLDEKLGSDVEVVSLGVPATSPDFYLRLWQLEGRRVDADLVLVGLTIGNDITDDAVAPRDEQRRSPLLRHSLAARAARNATIVWRYRSTSVGSPIETDPGAVAPGEPLRRYAERFDEERPGLPLADFRELTWKRTVVSRNDRQEDLGLWLARLRPTLADIDAEVRASGARCVFVLFPDEYQVDSALRQSVLDEFGDGQSLAVGRPQNRLRRFFERQGLSYVDLLQSFRVAGQQEGLYRPQDTHWNRRGNQLAAEVLARELALPKAD